VDNNNSNSKESTAVVKEMIFLVKTVVTTGIQATVRELFKSGSCHFCYLDGGADD
jgi:hypothetical protein